MRMPIILAASLLAAGCSNSHSPRGLAESDAVAHIQRAQQDNSTLSREHSVVVGLPESKLESTFPRVVDRCLADTAHHCDILQSDLSVGNSPSGLIKLRIDPDAVEGLILFAATLGHVERRSTTVEDLADSIQDTKSRIDMLTNYRKQLLDIQSKTGPNIDAAIKVASELSTVQSNLERATGAAAFQTKRTTTDVVTINFAVAEQKAFWRPVSEALRNFLGNLSSGISQAITAVAYIVPWLFVVVPGLYLLRFLWRRRSR